MQQAVISQTQSPADLTQLERALEEKERQLMVRDEQLATSQRLFRENPDGRITQLDEAYSRLEKMQSQLSESQLENQRLQSRALGDTQNATTENRELRAKIGKREAELKFSSTSEAEAVKLRRKLADTQARLKHCATNEAEEMVSLRLAKQQAEIDCLAAKKQMNLNREQLRDQERQIGELSSSLSNATRQVASRDKAESEASLLAREVRELKSKLVTAEADAAQRLRALLDARDEAAVASQQAARKMSEMERMVDDAHRKKTEDAGATAVSDAETRGQLEASRRLREVAENKLATEIKRNETREKELTQRVKELSTQLEAARVEVTAINHACEMTL